MGNLPAESPVLIQSGLAMLAMAKMSAARKRHPDITVSLSMPVGCFRACVSPERQAGHLGETDLSPSPPSHHRVSHPSVRKEAQPDRGEVGSSPGSPAHRVRSSAGR